MIDGKKKRLPIWWWAWWIFRGRYKFLKDFHAAFAQELSQRYVDAITKAIAPQKKPGCPK